MGFPNIMNVANIANHVLKRKLLNVKVDLEVKQYEGFIKITKKPSMNEGLNENYLNDFTSSTLIFWFE
jgi:hypothetical protein